MLDQHCIKYVEVRGLRTRYFEKGTGQPLVFIHGGVIGTGSSLEMFERNLEPLAHKFRVLALDKMGHGHTDNPATDSDYSIDAMTRHVHEFIRVMGFKRVNLIGQSRGAFNALSICLDDPGLVGGLVICNSASMVPGVPAVPEYSKKARAQSPYEAGTREWVRYRSKVMSYSEDWITDDYIDGWLDIYRLPKSAHAREKMKILSATQYEPSVDRAKEREIARIRAGALVLPVLIHWGESDPSAPLDPDGLAVHRLLAGNVEDVALHVVNRAGHFGFREKFVEFNAHIAAFFDSKNL